MRNFSHTMDVLVKAYFNDSLKHGACDACAVGNIIHSCSPFSQEDRHDLMYHNSGWVKVFCTRSTLSKKEQTIFPDQYIGVAKSQIDSTGYTWQELARIEKAFEEADTDIDLEANDDQREEFMFNGLMAVLEVLADIHQVSFDGRAIYEKQLLEIHETK